MFLVLLLLCRLDLTSEIAMAIAISSKEITDRVEHYLSKVYAANAEV
jgi:hypothetical protein